MGREEEVTATIETVKGYEVINPSPDYIFVDGVQSHWKRKKLIAKDHPEIPSYAGIDYMSGVWTVLIVASLYVSAYLFSESSWWLVGITAYIFGATASHSLWVLIHEFTHDLGFKSKFWNNAFLLIGNLPHLVPSAVAFADKHKQHHSYLNETYDDPDLPLPIEDTIFGHSTIGKFIWMLAFPLSMVIRQVLNQFYSAPSIIPDTIRIRSFHYWVVANWITNVSFNLAFFYFFGFKAIFFLFAAFVAGLGLHPLGARWVAEHYAIFPDQETYSYYGILNLVSFNIGYHNEHHDFPTIPWSRLPQVKKVAPKYYDTLHTHDSYLRVLWDFITNPNFTLRTRVVRESHRLKTKAQ